MYAVLDSHDSLVAWAMHCLDSPKPGLSTREIVHPVGAFSAIRGMLTLSSNSGTLAGSFFSSDFYKRLIECKSIESLPLCMHAYI